MADGTTMRERKDALKERYGTRSFKKAEKVRAADEAERDIKMLEMANDPARRADAARAMADAMNPGGARGPTQTSRLLPVCSSKPQGSSANATDSKHKRLLVSVFLKGWPRQEKRHSPSSWLKGIFREQSRELSGQEQQSPQAVSGRRQVLVPTCSGLPKGCRDG